MNNFQKNPILISEATRQFISRHQSDNVDRLALNARSISEGDVDVSAAITQIAGRQMIKDKIPSWYQRDDLVYPKQLPLEQCSSELTAKYKASLLSGRSFVDLTAGFGVDCAFIAGNFSSAVYVERQPELCAIARHNFSALNLDHITVVNEEAEDYLKRMEGVDCLFLDPARRAISGKKTVAISDCEPDVSQLKDILPGKADRILIKLSPMLDISHTLSILTNTSQVHVVSVENECKELLLLMQKGWQGEPVIACVNFRKKGDRSVFSFLPSEEKATQLKHASGVQEFLYEPNASLLKAGAYKLTAFRYGLQKLHPDSHLYTSPKVVPEFPGRSFRVRKVSTFNKKKLKIDLQGIQQANISVRNFPSSVVDVRKKLHLREGGDAYLFATTLKDGEKVLLICSPLTPYQR